MLKTEQLDKLLTYKTQLMALRNEQTAYVVGRGLNWATAIQKGQKNYETAIVHVQGAIDNAKKINAIWGEL